VDQIFFSCKFEVTAWTKWKPSVLFASKIRSSELKDIEHCSRSTLRCKYGPFVPLWKLVFRWAWSGRLLTQLTGRQNPGSPLPAPPQRGLFSRLGGAVESSGAASSVPLRAALAVACLSPLLEEVTDSDRHDFLGIVHSGFYYDITRTYVCGKKIYISLCLASEYQLCRNSILPA